MKTGQSTLNPHAESYVPLSKRVLPTKSPKVDNNDGTEAGLFPTGVTQALYLQKFTQRPELPSDELYGSSSQSQTELTDTQLMDMQFDIDMHCLRMNFNDISEESLSHAYLVNKCDLDETIDMLNQLELPDCLDIGDESEPGPSLEVANQKLKKVAGETCTFASSSCSEPVN